MNSRKFRISGTGCALVDYLYQPVCFTDDIFKKYVSLHPGDGGLSPGKLVFKDEFEQFSGEDYLKVREHITRGKPPVTLNIGGPSIVSLIHAAQMLVDSPAEVYFYGSKGCDEGAAFIEERLQKTPLKTGKYKTVYHQYTPFTDVLSDPDYDHGHGERIFINNIGAAWELYPDDLDDAFFASDIVVFGGTALTPNIHQSLLELLKRAKNNRAVTIVNTVYDFLNEKVNPEKAWPLGSSVDTYHYIDILITDMEEALRLSGSRTVDEAMRFFKSTGVGAVMVTHGANPVHYFSKGELFIPASGSKPVSEKVTAMLQHPERTGDTTGCGDNFVGGIIASVAKQLLNQPDQPVNLEEAIALGVVSGGYACFYHGGTCYEDYPGQKKEWIEPYYRDYLRQTGIIVFK